MNLKLLNLRSREIETLNNIEITTVEALALFEPIVQNVEPFNKQPNQIVSLGKKRKGRF